MTERIDIPPVASYNTNGNPAIKVHHMPKLDLNAEEAALLAHSMETEIKSVKRAQNSGKTPQIKGVYQQHETALLALQAKILTTK